MKRYIFDVDKLDESGCTLLHDAATSGNLKIFRLLMPSMKEVIAIGNHDKDTTTYCCETWPSQYSRGYLGRTEVG